MLCYPNIVFSPCLLQELWFVGWFNLILAVSYKTQHGIQESVGIPYSFLYWFMPATRVYVLDATLGFIDLLLC